MLFPDLNPAEFWGGVWGFFGQVGGVVSGTLFVFAVCGFAMWLVTRR